jgi:hypothetical protein
MPLTVALRPRANWFRKWFLTPCDSGLFTTAHDSTTEHELLNCQFATAQSRPCSVISVPAAGAGSVFPATAALPHVRPGDTGTGTLQDIGNASQAFGLRLLAPPRRTSGSPGRPTKLRTPAGGPAQDPVTGTQHSRPDSRSAQFRGLRERLYPSPVVHGSFPEGRHHSECLQSAHSHTP